MIGPYSFSEGGLDRTYVDVDAELDNLDLDEEISLGSDDLNYALGRPCDIDFEED
ncbi:MAG: hypothetical protein ACJZ9F_10650 [Rhodospirillaceae bacterium]